MRKLALVMMVGMGLVSGSLANEAATQPTSEVTEVQPTTAPAASEEELIKFTATKRTNTILKALALEDEAKEAKVRDVIMDFYVKRIGWGQKDDRLKELDKEIRKATEADDQAEVKALTDEQTALQGELTDLCESFAARLGEVLTDEEMVDVKDAMTYGRGKIIYNKVIEDNELTEPQQAVIAKLVDDAREQAWRAGTAGDKHKLFDKAVGRINIYLDALGKLEAIPQAIEAGQFDEAKEMLEKLEHRDWLREVLGQSLVDARKAYEAAKPAEE